MSQFGDTSKPFLISNLRLFLIASSTPAYDGTEARNSLFSLARHSDVAGRWAID
jgi:hypothetical protein